MLRIIGVDPGTGHDDEAVLLQNQGALKVYLAGYTILAVGGEAGTGRVWHVFREEAVIPPRGYVLLRTAVGVPCAAHTRDGHEVFLDYACSEETLNSWGVDSLRVLNPQTPYALKSASRFSVH